MSFTVNDRIFFSKTNNDETDILDKQYSDINISDLFKEDSDNFKEVYSELNRSVIVNHGPYKVFVLLDANNVYRGIDKIEIDKSFISINQFDKIGVFDIDDIMEGD